ncbi:hypothetical protein [Fischerella sp. JS2]|nr:hypothetical protein [Fischerella sp. JS2]
MAKRGKTTVAVVLYIQRVGASCGIGLAIAQSLAHNSLDFCC